MLYFGLWNWDCGMYVTLPVLQNRTANVGELEKADYHFVIYIRR